MHDYRFSKLVSRSSIIAAISWSMVLSSFPTSVWAQDAQEPAGEAGNEAADEPGADKGKAKDKPTDASAAKDEPTGGKEPAGDDAQQAAEPDEETRSQAREAYQKGQEAFDAGKYEEAYQGFKKANELIPSPQAQYWMAMSSSRADLKEEAEAALRAFLENPKAADVGEQQVAEAKQKLQEIEASKRGTVVIATNPAGATVSLDDEELGQTPVELELPPGKHSFKLSSPAYEEEQLEVEVKPGKLVERRVDLKVREAEVDVAPAPEAGALPDVSDAQAEPEVRSPVPAYITLGIAGVSGIVGTIFGVRALSAKSDFDDNPTESAADDVDRNALIADAAFGLTLTLGITGAVLLLNSGPQEKAEPAPAEAGRLKLTPFVGLNSAGASAEVTF